MEQPLLPDAFVWLWLIMTFRGIKLGKPNSYTPLSRLSSKRFASSGVKVEDADAEGAVPPCMMHSRVQ